MADDIVAELHHALIADKSPWDVTVYQRAIDEIEYLRKALDEYFMVSIKYRNSHSDNCECACCRRYEQAVRRD